LGDPSTLFDGLPQSIVCVDNLLEGVEQMGNVGARSLKMGSAPPPPNVNSMLIQTLKKNDLVA